jgi:single-strand DNA-binding protein
MPKSVNKSILLGNIGKDPEIRSTSGGTTVANLSIACSDRRKDSQGNWTDVTEWVSLVALGRTAEIVRDYVGKGSKIYVEGKIQTRSWEKDGQKHYKTEVLINELVLLDGKREESKSSRPAMTAKDVGFEQDLGDDDVPF